MLRIFKKRKQAEADYTIILHDPSKDGIIYFGQNLKIKASPTNLIPKKTFKALYTIIHQVIEYKFPDGTSKFYARRKVKSGLFTKWHQDSFAFECPKQDESDDEGQALGEDFEDLYRQYQ